MREPTAEELEKAARFFVGLTPTSDVNWTELLAQLLADHAEERIRRELAYITDTCSEQANYIARLEGTSPHLDSCSYQACDCSRCVKPKAIPPLAPGAVEAIATGTVLPPAGIGGTSWPKLKCREPGCPKCKPVRHG